MGLEGYYPNLTEKMFAEMSVSASIEHAGEQGRNNEKILMDYLKAHLPTRYSVTTGKVVSADGDQSAQTDIIIVDRLNSPALVTTHGWDLVPVEATVGVISVKTTLNRSEMQNAVDQIASVRRLTARPVKYVNGQKQAVARSQVLRPRGMIFAYKSDWKEATSAESAFQELIGPVPDDFRPNGVCILDQCCIMRKPYSLETRMHTENVCLIFFIFLNHLLETFPPWRVNLEAYFGQFAGGGDGDSVAHDQGNR
jgi:hypothetical protein